MKTINCLSKQNILYFMKNPEFLRFMMLSVDKDKKIASSALCVYDIREEDQQHLGFL